jgi:ABC-type glycerol-3-phosphate transport system substrate-binding protein
MTTTGFRFTAVLAAGLLAAACSACSFSASSRSSSRSSSSPSRSSSAHGEKEPVQEKKKEIQTSHSAFQEEIAAIAVLYVGSSGTAEDFQRDISAAAKRNGIPYWELDERVFTAIGIGLQRAGVSREAIAGTPFLQGVRNAALFDAIGNAYGAGD